MELTAQPWASSELLGPSSLPWFSLEDTISVSGMECTSPIEKIYRGHEV